MCLAIAGQICCFFLPGNVRTFDDTIVAERGVSNVAGHWPAELSEIDDEKVGRDYEIGRELANRIVAYRGAYREDDRTKEKAALYLVEMGTRLTDGAPLKAQFGG
jgi:hypothetical protein